MHRVWDWIVAVTMIAIAIVVGGIIAGMIAISVMLGLSYLINLEGQKGGMAFLFLTVGVFAILQTVAFYEFYRRRRANYVTGDAGFFFLIPRAVQRMRTGYELEGFVDATTGKTTTIQAPVNAARRGILALLLSIASIAAVFFGAQAKGEWPLVVAGAGLIGFFAGLVLLMQVMLTYVGFIRR
jgi:hypothetical protein